MIDEETILSESNLKKNLKIPITYQNKFFIFLFLFIFLISSGYFLYLQFYLKDKLLKVEEEMKSITYFSFPARGDIYDRNKKLIATSEISFDIYVDLTKVQSLPFRIEGQYFYRGNQLIIRNVPRETALKLLTQKIDNIEIISSFKRKYNFGEEMGNLIGFIGFPTENEDYHPEEFVGKSGLELSYQNFLRGVLGQTIYKKVNKSIRKVNEIKPKPGMDLFLTIDSEFQKKAYKLIDDYFKEKGYKRGVFIALNPQNGEIISLISYPSYNPNWFFENKQKFSKALKDENQPFFNRAISGLYNPGSTIKPIVAAAALEEKIVTPETKIYSAGYLKIPHPYFPGVFSIFRDNKVHGWTDIKKAIADSVNVYFYVVAGGYPYPNEEIPIKDGLGIESLIKYWKLFNLGEKTGIDLVGEKEGFLPSPETKAKNIFDPIWRLGDTYNVAIGQGDLLVTPLQISLWTAALATNKIYQPFIVKKIISPEGKIILEKEPKVLKENLISQENLKIIQEGMRQTVTQGTAKILNDLPVKVAGKSGTPEIFGKKRLNAIFTGYFPYENPQVVMTLLIEDVPIGSVATLPLYKDLVLTYYELNLKAQKLQ
jgi:penicillin-binding protein 2